MNRNPKVLILATAFLLLSTPVVAAAQNGVVYGTVYDIGGIGLANVTVKLENSAIGFSRTLTTKEDGSFQFSAVPPAAGYTITAWKGNQKLDVRPDITINVDDERPILPPLREGSAIAAQGSVQESRARPETASTAVSRVITGEQLRSLPLYNRNFLVLGLLAPGTHDAEQGSALAEASFSISGMRSTSNNFLLDGADNVASSSNQAVPFQVNDAIQEFRVITANAPAEYGRNMGGAVNIVTRRGGNDFHGSAFGYFANDALNAEGPLSVYNGTTFDKAAAYAGAPRADTTLGTNAASFPLLPADYNSYVNIARNNGFCTDSIMSPADPRACVANRGGANTFFDPATLLRTNDRFKQPFDSKQFGANAGGAPKKDKLFVFGSYEATYINNSNPILERVPSDFNKTYNPLNAPTTAGSRTLFSRTNPDYVLAQSVLSLFPQANVVGVPGVLEFYRGEAPNYTHVHNVLLRADWVKSEKTTLSARYVTQVLNQLHDDSLPAPLSASGYPGNGAFRHALNQNLSVAVTRNFSSSMINEVRVGFSRFNVRETEQDSSFDARSIGLAGANFPNAAMPTVLLNGLDFQSSGARLGANGAIGNWIEAASLGGAVNAPMAPSLDGVFPFARIGAPLIAPSRQTDTTIFGAERISLTRGRHSMKAGVEVRRLTNNVFNGAFQRGFIYSANIGEFTSDSESCNQICSSVPDAFLRPSFDYARFDGSPLSGDFHSWAPALFFQDTWRMGPRVTLNMGVRYEYFSPQEESQGRTWNFDPVAGGLVPSGGSPTTVDPFGNNCNPSGPPPLFRGTPAMTPISASPWTNCTASGDPTTVQAEHKDLAPRIGVAWDVFGSGKKSGKTVVRAGAGVFWDQLPVNYVSQLLFNRPVTGNNAIYGQLQDARTCPSSQCGLGNSMINPQVRAAQTLDGVTPNSGWTEAAFPLPIFARDSNHSHTPREVQLNFSTQQQISEKLAVEVGYMGALGRNLPVVFNSNFATAVSFGISTDSGNFERFPVFTMNNQGESNYHSLVVRAHVAEWRGLRMNPTYVFSRSLDNAPNIRFSTAPTALGISLVQQLISAGNSVVKHCFPSPDPFCRLLFPSIDIRSGAVTTTGAGQILVTPYSLPQDPFRFLGDDYGRSDFDVTNRFVLDYTWEVPLLKKGRGWSKWVDYWQVSGIFIAQSGQPLTIFATPAFLSELTQRVNLIGEGPRFDMSNPDAAISTSGLAIPLATCGFLRDPSTACTGNSPRNGFTGPNFVNFNMAIQKGIPIAGKEKRLSFRAEFYNLFNRANFYNPISEFSNGGVNINPNFGKIKSAHAPRQVQFAARFTW